MLPAPTASSATSASIKMSPEYGATNRRTVSIGGDCRSSVALSSASSALLRSGSGDGSSGIGVVALDVLNVGMPSASSVLK